jgi:cryptochrome
MTTNSGASGVALHWFRKGLRLHDNPALADACRSGVVYPVFIIDPYFANPQNVGSLRYKFLLDSLQDLDASLRAAGSRLYCARGKPLDVLASLAKEWKVTKITFEADSEPYAQLRDAELMRLAGDWGVEVTHHASHTLHDLDRYIAQIERKHEKIPVSYGSFQKLFATLGKPPACAATVDSSLMPSNAGNLSIDETQFSVPTMTDMGYPDDISLKYPGGETEALLRLNKCLSRKNWIANFEKPKTSPNSLEPSTTVLSPYLKFGCLSARQFYHALSNIYEGAKSHSQPPVSLHGQLLWREFFYLCGYGVPNFYQMEGNPICRQIPWQSDDALLKAWEESRTGFPWIDAVMAQLRTEGWIHHLARHAVACFLTRGDLWQSWEAGARVFEKYLLDADPSINSANWQWLSCSTFFYQYFRCYSPVAFGKKTDKSGDYIRKYMPKLRRFSDKYIYEPWTAPLHVQEKAGCIIGQDYPHPIVDHSVASKLNMERMKAAYAAQKASGLIVDATACKSKKRHRDEPGR